MSMPTRTPLPADEGTRHKRRQPEPARNAGAQRLAPPTPLRPPSPAPPGSRPPQLHSLTAKSVQPHLAGSSGSLTGGIAVRSVRSLEADGSGGEGSARARSLVEQLPGSQRLTALASAAVDLVSRRSELQPSAPTPDTWLEVGGVGVDECGARGRCTRLEARGGAALLPAVAQRASVPQKCCSGAHPQVHSWQPCSDVQVARHPPCHFLTVPPALLLLQGAPAGEWPKPYRNKTRLTIPSSVSQWKCGAEAAEFTHAAAATAPPLQSSAFLLLWEGDGGRGPGAAGWGWVRACKGLQAAETSCWHNFTCMPLLEPSGYAQPSGGGGTATTSAYSSGAAQACQRRCRSCSRCDICVEHHLRTKNLRHS